MHIVKILDIQFVTHNVKRFVVSKPESYEFTPGQATDVAINKPGWEEKKHSFTFTSLDVNRNLEFTIKGYPVAENPNHEGVTEMLHKLCVGDELLIGDPWGTIVYKGLGTFLAAGAGITPFIAIFRELYTDNQLSGNKLIFSNKTAADIILRDEFEKIFRPEDLVFTLTQEENHNFEYGRISEELLKKHVTDFSQHFYLCGPKPFVASMKEVLSKLGANTDSVVFEE